MIQLRINDRVLAKHEAFIFGKNKEKNNRIYKKVNRAYQNQDNDSTKRVFKFILNNFKEIILGDTKKLYSLKDEYRNLVDSISSDEVKNQLFEDLKIFHEEYQYFYRSKDWNAYYYQKELGINICPYCGTQFIFIYKDRFGKTRGTLDHYIDKAKYPIFSVSIYNLIPSCKVCNSDFKGSLEMDLENYYSPFEENIVENITFKRVPINKREDEITSNEIIDIKKEMGEEIDYVSMFLGMNEDFNIKIDYTSASNTVQKKIEGNLQLFHIEEIYNAYHKTYIQDVIKKAYIYNHVYRMQLINSFRKFFLNEEELKKEVIPALEDDSKRILGKLTRDIVNREIKDFNL